ncbi:M24 family metallopeptidase [Allorhodopirellula solitaria]|uniref:Aminopeptidase n=1 Tax=Allorhodopirellula solitaria TaxID=2527987 RepID=A0A5C5YFK9_9BACT|nr:M24 family metallopeptidase [Allorhodopirellula solitaria]TWT73125.1 Aminopeptidase [Allorhodopirellula solitaria]
MSSLPTASICAGIPAINNTLYRRIQFSVGDPTVLIEVPAEKGTHSLLLLRDVEIERAKKFAKVDQVGCPADFTPEGGLSGDRETATAQASAEYLRRQGVKSVVADRSLPLIYAKFLGLAGIEVSCDENLWVVERRQKSEVEIEHLREAQRVTEQAIQYACEMIAKAEARSGGVLYHDGAPLTSERVRTSVDVFLLKRGFTTPTAIIAGGPAGADCHNHGAGELLTESPVIVDIFPRSQETRYNGDCTRTVVHGSVSDDIKAMHAAVREAIVAGKQATKAGVTGEDVHVATIGMLQANGFDIGLPGEDDPDFYCAMTCGTGHGIGLEVHEPPLLDFKGPTLLAGEALTIEPGLYRRDLGGVRIEDMVVVTPDGCLDLNELHDGLDWT